MLLYRLPQYGLYHELFVNIYLNPILATFDGMAVAYSMLLDVIGHTIIAMNRFSAIFFPMNHDSVC